MAVGHGYRKWLTPLAREVLASACDVLIDAFFDEYDRVDSWRPESIGATRLGKRLPRLIGPNYTGLHYKKFGICIVVVAWKLAQPQPFPLASLGEQLAACAIIEEAGELALQSPVEGGEEAARALQRLRDRYVKPAPLLAARLAPCANGQDVVLAEPAPLDLGPLFQPLSRRKAVHPCTDEVSDLPRVGQAYNDLLLEVEREALDAGVAILIDGLFDDFSAHSGLLTGESPDLTTLGEHLPRRYLPRYAPAFYKRFAVCILTVAWKLAQPERWPLSSVAEEMAAQAILAEAEQFLAGEREEAEADEEGDKRDFPPDEWAFVLFRESFFEDEDALTLFDDEFDGVDAGPVGQLLHMASLAFEDWFKPFGENPAYIAHPYVYGG